MARPFYRILQIATIVIFVFLLFSILGIFKQDTWDINSVYHILGALKNTISDGLYFSLATISCGGPEQEYGVGYFLGIGRIDVQVAVYGNMFKSALEPMVFQFLNQSFSITFNPSYHGYSYDGGLEVVYNSLNDMFDGIPNYTTVVVDGTPEMINLPPIFNLFGGEGLTILENFYKLLLILFLVLAVVYFIMFLGRADIKYSLLSGICTLAPLLLAVFETLLLTLINFILSLFAGVEDFDFATVSQTIENALPQINFRDTTLLSKSISSSVLVMGFFMYVYFELTFQTAYVGRVTQPSIQRTKRLERQLTIIGEQSLLLELEKEKQMRETGLRSAITGKAEGEKKVTIKSFFTGEGLSSIRDMLERREREREKERLEEVSSDTRRLNSYTRRLFEVDSEAKKTLTAAGSAPTQRNMISSTLLNMGFRLLFLFLLTIVIINPILFFQVFGVPEIISQSVGFNSPEAIITVIIPIALLFPVVSFVIRVSKKYQLTQIMKKREEQSDFLRRLSELREIESAEVVSED
ncbi:MAG: hypothetical protein ACFFCS_06165 [Candidatus Hodarchaeota archaeon]